MTESEALQTIERLRVAASAMDAIGAPAEAWISVEERMPELPPDDTDAPVWTWDGQFVSEDDYGGVWEQPAGPAVGGWLRVGDGFTNDKFGKVTHWMPRKQPSPPGAALSSPAPQGESKLRDARMEPFDQHGPLPGMIAAFETHFGQSWTDRGWRGEASTWAAAWGRAWNAALAAPATPEPAQMPTPVAHVHSNGDFCWDRHYVPKDGLWPVYLLAEDEARAALRQDPVDGGEHHG